MTAAVTLNPAAGYGVSMLISDGAGLGREGPASR